MNTDMKHLMHILSYKRPHGSTSEEEFIQKVLLKRCPQLVAIGPAGDESNYAIDVGKESKTLFSCHLDTVHRQGGRQQPRIDKELEIIFAPKGECLGADNGAGVWLLLSMIDAGIPGYYVFHRGEEAGGIGSRWLSNNAKTLLKGFDRAIAFDRRDSNSVITHQRGDRCCSEVFAKALGEALEYQHAPDPTGSFTDTANYTEIIPECTNISVGYMNEHGPDEYLDTNYLFWLAGQVQRVKWEMLPTVRDPEQVDYYGDRWRKHYYGGYRPSASSLVGVDEVDNMADLTTTTYEETLLFVQDYPEDAAWLLQNYMEENGLNLSDLVNGAEELNPANTKPVEPINGNGKKFNDDGFSDDIDYGFARYPLYGG